MRSAFSKKKLKNKRRNVRKSVNKFHISPADFEAGDWDDCEDEFELDDYESEDDDYVHKTRGVDLQVAGQDQWGNITAGIDLIRKKTGDQVHCFTMPLLTKKDGTKFGKSEGGAVWLDKDKTSPYELYQFLLNAEDEKVIDYLKFLTFLSVSEIEELETSLKNEPELRLAQKALAREVVTYIHGEDLYKEAVNITNSLFSGDIANLSVSEIEMAFKGLQAYSIDRDTLLVDLLVDSNICKSKREAREFISSNSISVNGKKINDLDCVITRDMAIEDKYIVIRRGKKKYYIIKFN